MHVKKERNSIFELLRIIAMLFIITYHLFLFNIEPYYHTPFYKGIQIPLHIGVIIFVLISGYWGIKPNFKGLIKLIGIIFVYYFPLQFTTTINDLNGGGKELLKSILFISNSPYWFIRTYICLYLFSPIVNLYLLNINRWNRLALILTLSFISIYIGTSHGDSSLADGKNLVNFSLIYILGNSLRYYQDKWMNISTKKLFITYILLNSILVLAYLQFHNTIIGTAIWILSFPYCSPLLILNSILFFILISRYKLTSNRINSIAASMFAVYLIHCHPYIEKEIIAKCINIILVNIHTNNIFIISIITVCISFMILGLSIFVDKLLSPVWKIISIIGDKANHKLQEFKVKCR